MSTATAKKQETGFDLNAILTGASKKDKKSTSKVPILSVPDTTKQLVTVVRGMKEELDSVKSMYEVKESELITVVQPDREKLCMNGYVSSVKIPDSEGLSVTLSWKDAYSKIDVSNAPVIEEIVGQDKYPQFFETKMTITVKDISESALTALIQAVGPDEFGQYFEIERSLKPTPRYTTEFLTFKPEQREKLAQYVKQYKPALKTK